MLVASLTATQWAWGLGTGVLLAGYVGTWLAALRRAPASVVASVLVLGAPITAVLTAVVKRHLAGSGRSSSGRCITLAVAAVAVLAIRSARGRRMQPAAA